MVKKKTKKKSKFKVFTICPKCGADMLVINGRYGEFYSCSRFKCNYKPTQKEIREKAKAKMKVSQILTNKRKNKGHLRPRTDNNEAEQ